MPLRSLFIRSAAAAVLAAAAMPAVAQTQAPAPGTAAGPSPQTTIPEQVYPCNPGSYEPPAGADNPQDKQEAKDLADCEGVIEPPKTGDSESEVPPPAGGKTPVIPPDSVPRQPSDQG